MKKEAYRDSEEYYNTIAGSYDSGKKKNLYYFNNLVSIYKSFVPPQSEVLEVGCGTGDLITTLNVRKGLGIDLSEKMIDIARAKYASLSHITYERQNIFDSRTPFTADYTICADVLEHVHNLPEFLNQLFVRTKPGNTTIISVANPKWEWIMDIGEKFNLKIPEGPHERISIQETERLYAAAGFKLLERGYRFLVPKRIPGSEFINKIFYKSKLLAPYGFTVYWVLTK